MQLVELFSEFSWAVDLVNNTGDAQPARCTANGTVYSVLHPHHQCEFIPRDFCPYSRRLRGVLYSYIAISAQTLTSSEKKDTQGGGGGARF